MAAFGAPTDGIVLTHFIASDNVERSRRFYTEVLGGETVRSGEPSWGAEFLTAPKRHATEIRCYIRDRDGHLIEVGQATRDLRRDAKP